MKLKVLSIIIFSTFYINGCSSDQKASNGKIELEKSNYSLPKLSYGTAKITASILKHSIMENGFEFLIKIDTVHGYGPATPPLAVDSEIKAFGTYLDKTQKSLLTSLENKNEKIKLEITFIPSRNTSERYWQINLIYH